VRDRRIASTSVLGIRAPAAPVSAVRFRSHAHYWRLSDKKPLDVSSLLVQLVGVVIYIVRYYCPRASRKGKGVQTARFTDRAQAEQFARGRRLYSRPAVVEECSA
jgi:hypothetical protein